MVTIACIWVTDGVDRCRVRFLMCHMVKHDATRYDGALTQVTRVLSGNEIKAKRGYCQATIISCLPEVKSHWLLAEEVTEKKEVGRGVVEKREQENVMTMGDIKGGHPRTTDKANVKKQRDNECFINCDDEKYSNF